MTGSPAVSSTTICMPGVWPGAGTSRRPGSSSCSPSTGTYSHAGGVDPLADGVVVLVARVVELLALDVDRPAGEEVVAAAVVEVQVGVDDDVDAGEIEVLLVQGPEPGIEVGDRRVQLGHAGVDQHARLGVVDDVHVDRHPLVLGEQVGDEDRRHADRGGHAHRALLGASCAPDGSACPIAARRWGTMLWLRWKTLSGS